MSYYKEEKKDGEPQGVLSISKMKNISKNGDKK